jgi:excisionase family DNA binding protein
MLILPDIIAEIDQLASDELPRLMLYVAARMAAVKSTPATAEDELLSVKEAAIMLGVSRSKLYHDSTLPFMVKVGSSRRFSRNGIQKFIEKQQGKA